MCLTTRNSMPCTVRNVTGDGTCPIPEPQHLSYPFRCLLPFSLLFLFFPLFSSFFLSISPSFISFSFLSLVLSFLSLFISTFFHYFCSLSYLLICFSLLLPLTLPVRILEMSDWTLLEDGCFKTGYLNTVHNVFSLIFPSSFSTVSSISCCTKRPLRKLLRNILVYWPSWNFNFSLTHEEHKVDLFHVCFGKA